MKDYWWNIKKLVDHYGLIKIAKTALSEAWRKIYWERLRNSYAQNQEDLIIDKVLGKKKNGFYVDIGAYHPTRLSNTYRFYKKGWQGLLVEPNPTTTDRFYKIRPRDQFLNIGLGKNSGLVDYYVFLIPALNTFLKEEAEESQTKGHKLQKIIKIKVIPVASLMNKYLTNNFSIDILSIDCEGMDNEILSDWDWKNHPPSVLIIEKLNEPYFIAKKGYCLAGKTKYNQIFIKNDVCKLEPGDGRKP